MLLRHRFPGRPAAGHDPPSPVGFEFSGSRRGVLLDAARMPRQCGIAGLFAVRSRKWPRFTVDGSRAAAGALGAHGFNGLLIVPRQTYARAYASASASTSVRNRGKL